MKAFDVENWNRKKHYEFFKTYEDPFFNITSNIEVTNLYNYCKKQQISFSLSCLYVAIKCINEITEFKLRLNNGKVYVFEEVHIGSTILNDDNTFSFCYFDYQKRLSLHDFVKAGQHIIEDHKRGVKFEAKEEAIDVVHCTTLPWVSFTGFKHARNGDEGSKGIPKIVFGKLFDENNSKKMPFSVEVHHALMDGFHVATLFSKMQLFIDDLQ